MKKKLINIMLQYYYNIKIMLIVYSLDQYVFFIMEYLFSFKNKYSDSRITDAI